jgi:hypothetical protein
VDADTEAAGVDDREGLMAVINMLTYAQIARRRLRVQSRHGCQVHVVELGDARTQVPEVPVTGSACRRLRCAYIRLRTVRH